MYWAAIFLIVVSMGDTCTCRKNKKEPCPIIYMEQDLKDYCVFKPGTWWVYEEETSKERDSVYIISSITKISGCDVVRNDYENNLQQLQSSLYGQYGQETNFVTSAKQATRGGGLPIYFSGNLQDSIRYGNGYVTYYNFLENYAEGDISHSKVKFFRVYNAVIPKLLFIHAKNIGIIRMEFFNGKKWNLVKYKIVQ